MNEYRRTVSGEQGSQRAQRSGVRVPGLLLSSSARVVVLSILLLSPAVCHKPSPSLCTDPPSWFRRFTQVVYDSPLWTLDVPAGLQHEASRVYTKGLISQLLYNVSEFAGYGIPDLQNTTRPVNLAASLNCSHPDYDMMLSGVRRAQPRRVIMLTPLAAELHILSLRLHMYHDLVDQFVLHEGTLGQYSLLRKPLMFERFKHRFAQFLPQILHLVTDDRSAKSADFINQFVANGTVHWSVEYADRKSVLWHVTTKVAAHNDDLLIYGDQDEFIGEEYLYHLKHCEFKEDARLPFSSNAPFIMGDFRFGFRNDWPPADNFAFSLKFPSIWTFEALRKLPKQSMLQVRHYKEQNAFPKRPEGFHLTEAYFLPALISKRLVNAEGSLHGMWANTRHRNMTQLCQDYADGFLRQIWGRRIIRAECLRKLYKTGWDVPWLVAQNPGAFPWLFVGAKTTTAFDPDADRPVSCPESVEDARQQHGYAPRKRLGSR